VDGTGLVDALVSFCFPSETFFKGKAEPLLGSVFWLLTIQGYFQGCTYVRRGGYIMVERCTRVLIKERSILHNKLLIDCNDPPLTNLFYTFYA
jgi:hypothetical protein